MMYDRMIVAAADRSQRDSWKLLVELFLKKKLGPQATVVSCRDAHELALVLEARSDSRDLVILDAELPAAPDDGPDGENGLALVQRLQGAESVPACIVVEGSSRLPPAWVNKLQMWKCRLLSPTTPRMEDLVQVLIDFGRAMALGKPPEPAAPWAMLEVNVKGPLDSSFTLHLSDRPQEEKSFDLDIVQLEAILARSREIRHEISTRLPDRDAWRAYDWKKAYADLGRQVFSLINRDGFQRLWGKAEGRAESNARLRFTLDSTAYDGLWESIYDDSRETYLMLNGGVARRARVPSGDRPVVVRPLDAGDGKINMLVISSNIAARSKVHGPEDRDWEDFYNLLKREKADALETKVYTEDLFPPLGDLATEIAALKRVEAQQNAAAGGTELVIEILESDDPKDRRPLHERVRSALTGPVPPDRKYRYDVVHFAGHALFGPEAGERGYLIFGSPETTEAVPVSVFAGWLKQADVQLVYLNCCRSSASTAAFELARSGVPLAIGFAWDLDTDKAVQFASRFYELLVEKDLKVCQAFQLARQEFHRNHLGGHPIWTAPVLVAQPDGWEKVETCFARA